MEESMDPIRSVSSPDEPPPSDEPGNALQRLLRLIADRVAKRLKQKQLDEIRDDIEKRDETDKPANGN
jgi:hypothetical protein